MALPSQSRYLCVLLFMRHLLLITTLLISNNLQSQYRIDSQVKTEFKAVLSKEPTDIRKKSLETTLGFGILYFIKEDTLNIFDLIPNIPDKTLKIYNLKSGKKMRVDHESASLQSHPWVSGSSSLCNDTLEMQFGAGFMAGFGFTLKVYDRILKAEYFEYSMQDSIYFDIANKKKTSDIHITANLKILILSEKVTAFSNEFYGKAVFESNSFYQHDSNFKEGYILKKKQIACIFRVKVNIPNNEN